MKNNKTLEDLLANPEDPLDAHYAHTAISTANMAHIYNYLLAANTNPMRNVEQHPDTLAEVERAYNL